MLKTIAGILLLGAAFFLPVQDVRGDLVSHWTLDGGFEDSQPAGNNGVFRGAAVPSFDEGFDGTPGGAAIFDGVDDFVEVIPQQGLPIYANPAYSVAMWVKGLPQPDRRVFSEASSTTRNPLFNIGTQVGGAAGTVDIYIRTAGNQVLVSHVNSTAVAFDGEWHHIAWVDNNGQAVLYIDGVPDATVFNYTKPAMPFNRTTIGGILRDVPCCWFNGMIDDVRIYDHALTEFEVQELLPSSPGCPVQGDTHCGTVSIAAPPGSIPGPYTITALGAVDDSGDPIRYFFEARSNTGQVLRAGPQLEPEATLELRTGTWEISVTVDDDPNCGDLAADAVCAALPLTVVCPVAGDTHCAGLDAVGPLDGSPGTYAVSVLGAFDDSGNPILYSFRAESDRGVVLTTAPQAAATVNLNLGAEGMWTITATVDDDPDCPDAAADATCVIQVAVVCPQDADTHCDDLQVAGPPDFTPGIYTAAVLSAFDESLDPVLFTFHAVEAAGESIWIGPQAANSADFLLGEGEWTIRVIVDDNPGCFDRAADAVCEAVIDVEGDPSGLISRWAFDGDTLDSEPSANDGVFVGDVAPLFVEGFDGTPLGAIQLDGLDDYVQALHNRSLPLYAHSAFSIAMWVRGARGQADRRIWSEGWTLGNTPLFTLGTDSAAQTGQLDLFVRSSGNQTVVPHLRSALEPFDANWHHIAYAENRGRGAFYIDGVRDATAIRYVKPQLALDLSSIGAVLRAAPSHYFSGALDDVRIYNFALSDAEVAALVPPPAGCPASGDTHCAGLTVTGPGGGAEGSYTAAVDGAGDDSGDPLIYTFTAEDARGNRLQRGPQAGNSATFVLFAGDWTIRAAVDDDLSCPDRAADAVCSQAVAVTGYPEELLSHWRFDGGLDDSRPAGNHGTFAGAPAPVFDSDRDGNPMGALRFDGTDDHVVVTRQSGLPLYANREFSVAMWVKGLPQPDRRVWSESASDSNAPLFNIGTASNGLSGRVDIFIRDPAGAVIVPHVLSGADAFDGTWHHIAWVDAGGDAALYIDGALDTRLRYNRPAMPFNVTTIGGILRAGSCCWFGGLIDDVRAYTYALGLDEVRELAGLGGPAPTPFRRGDADGNGSPEITDAINILGHLFLGDPAPGCREAADVDDNGSLEITDAINLLGFLFLGEAPPPSPGPTQCGPDPQGSPEVGCDSYTECR